MKRLTTRGSGCCIACYECDESLNNCCCCIEIEKCLVRLKDYEDTGLTPEEIMGGKMLTGWISVEERLPETNRTVLIFAESTTIQGGTIMLAGACNNGYWFVQNGQNTLGFPCSEYNIVAWMSLPEPYNPVN